MNEKKCEVCEMVIPHRPYQDYAIVRACSAHCAGALAKREDPTRSHGEDRCAS